MGVDGRGDPRRARRAPEHGGPAESAPVGGEGSVGGKGSSRRPPRRVPRQREAGGEAAVAEGHLADADLITRMRDGDTHAYDELYRRHAEAVRSYARTCSRDAHTADDLTHEVFARTLQAVRGGAGPQVAVRAYLLTTVRRVAATWARTAMREQLVEDFAEFAVSAAGSSANDDALDLGPDVRAMREAEQSMAVRAFRSLPERWQTVLWHTTVEESSPQDVAPLMGLTANATAVLAHRAREGLKQAYLQAHVSVALTAGGACAGYAGRLGAYARGGLRTRAERGLRKHLADCAKCRTAALEVKDVNKRLRALLPTAVIGWFATTYALKAAGVVAGVGSAGAGAGSAAAASGLAGTAGAAGGASGAAGAAGATGTSGASGAAGASGASGAFGASETSGASGTSSASGSVGSSAASEGLGAPAKAGIAVGLVVVAASAALAMMLVGEDKPAESRPRAVGPSAAPSPLEPSPTPTPGPEKPLPPPAPESTPEPAPDRSSAPPTRTPSPAPTSEPSTPSAPPAAAPAPRPTSPPPAEPAPTPSPAPMVYPLDQLPGTILGGGEEPAVRLTASGWMWRRWALHMGGEQYARGVTVHPPSSVLIELNRPCVSYRAMAGVDDMTKGWGGVRFSVYGDRTLLWTSGVLRSGDRAVPVQAPLSGRRTLRLVVRPAERSALPGLPPADWANARIICR